jgi:HEAT repeat protein
LAADWLRDLARTAKTSRLYAAGNSVVEEARAAFARTSAEAIDSIGGWTFRITPEEILLGDEWIIQPQRRGPARGEIAQKLIEQLPFRLYRDGVRELTLLPGILRRDIDALVDALAISWTDRDRADDIVTALWQANPTHLRFEAAPPEQPLYVANGHGGPRELDRGLGLGFGLPPLGAEVRARLGDRGGAVGLHKETGHEDGPPPIYMQARRTYDNLKLDGDVVIRRLLARWDLERARDWHDEARELFATLRSSAPDDETTRQLCRFLVTGIAAAIDDGRWAEATRWLEDLARLDPQNQKSGEWLMSEVERRSESELGETLEAAGPDDLEAFFSMLLALGPSGIPLGIAALRGARKGRTRAAVCAAMAYLCADHVQSVVPALTDSSPEVVRHAVIVLGHIGGNEAGSLCSFVANHPDNEVKREVARSIPAFPDPQRTDLILQLLSSSDPQTVLLTLRSARRQGNRSVSDAIVRMIEAADFEQRPEEIRRTLFQTLADIADTSVVPALEAFVMEGGWFARANWRRSAAGQTLLRMAIPEAQAAVARARAHHNDVIRAVCGESSSRSAA